MKIQLFTYSRPFCGALSQNNTKDSECIESVTDIDEVKEYIKNHKKEDKTRNISKFPYITNEILEQTGINLDKTDDTGNTPLRKNKKIFNLKNLTIKKLQQIGEESSINELLDFHAGRCNRNNILPLIYFYRNRGKSLGINSYMKELIKELEKFPQAIAKILITKDREANVMPSLFLSKGIWIVLMEKVLEKEKEYIDILKAEFVKQPKIYPKALSAIFGPQKPQKKEAKVKKEVHKKNNQKPKTKLTNQYKSFIKSAEEIALEEKTLELKNLKEYIFQEESKGNMFWYDFPYKKTSEPILFTLFDLMTQTNDSNLVDSIITKLKQISTIDYNITDSNGIPVFVKILQLQNEKLLDIVKDKTIAYSPIFDETAKKIENQSFISKAKECNIYFPSLNKVIKEQSYSKAEELLSDLNSIFYTREKSGLYLLKSLLETRNEDFIMRIWTKYSNLLPIKSGKIISKFITKNFV